MGGVFLAARHLGIVSKVAPEQITGAALDAAGSAPDDTVEDAASTASHLAYGAANGAVFAVVGSRLPGGPLVRGLTFAGALLLVSYEGWVPATRVMAPLHRQTTGGRWTLIAGHAVYGTVLGLLTGCRTRP